MNARRTLLLVALGLAAGVVWAASGELRWPARAFTTFLLVPLPALLIVQARLVGQVALAGTVPRLPVYASSALAQWSLALLAALAARHSGLSAYALGLVRPPHWGTQLLWAASITIAAVGVTLLAHRAGVRESPTLSQLLPRTAREKAAFLGLSATAGVCEEIVFRGFLLAALVLATGSLVPALLVSSVAFGVVHAYQDPAGVARASVLGLLLAAPLVATGSLAASIIAHAAIDVIAGLWLGPWLLRSES